MKEFLLATFFGLIFITTFSAFAVCCDAGLPDDRAVKAIIGEAEGEGYPGMKAVACALRNRGNLKGVYGLRSYRVIHHLYSEDIEAQAYVAWQTSEDPYECRFIGGADSWYSLEDYQKLGIPKGKEVVYNYRNQVFFKNKPKWSNDQKE